MKVYREYGLWPGYGLGVLIFRYVGRSKRMIEVYGFERDTE